MSDQLKDKLYRINCLTEDINSLYHQAALKLGMSDSVMFVLYMLHISGEKCLLYDIYKLSGISKQTINSAIRKLENEEMIYLEKHNGKSKIVCLTEKGRECSLQTAARLAEAERRAFDDWSEEEIDLYVRLIEKNDASLRREIEKL